MTLPLQLLKTDRPTALNSENMLNFNVLLVFSGRFEFLEPSKSKLNRPKPSKSL